MSRSCAYRLEVSEACNWHQDEALNSNLYILLTTGPTGFLLKDEDESKNFKVFLGDLHTCTCPVFKKEKDLCKHICWLLLKKFRLARTNPLSWQLGLCEREVNDVLRGSTNKEAARDKKVQKKKAEENTVETDEQDDGIVQRDINEEDVCPICQDEFFPKRLPVTYCKFGCGNSVHLKCIKVWADHQKTNNETQLKCPLCREIFSTFEQIDEECRNNNLIKTKKQPIHYGLTCASCKASPITGKLYKCSTCLETYLCEGCFSTDFHKQHQMLCREGENTKYHKVDRGTTAGNPLAPQNTQLLRQRIPSGRKSTASTMDLKNNESLLRVTEKIIKSWPVETIKHGHKLLKPGSQCRVCLKLFRNNQTVRKLPRCKHRFHVGCIDKWLLDGHPTCPIDGQIVWQKEEKKEPEAKPIASNERNNTNNLNFQVASFGLQIRSKFGTDLDINQKFNKNDPKTRVRKHSLSRNKNDQQTSQLGFFVAGQNMPSYSTVSNHRQELTSSESVRSTNTINSRTQLPKMGRLHKKAGSLAALNPTNEQQGTFGDPGQMIITKPIKAFDVFQVGTLIKKPYQLTRAVNNTAELYHNKSYHSGNNTRNFSHDYHHDDVNDDYIDALTPASQDINDINMSTSTLFRQILDSNTVRMSNRARDHDSDSVSSIPSIAYHNNNAYEFIGQNQLMLGSTAPTTNTTAQTSKSKLKQNTRQHHSTVKKKTVKGDTTNPNGMEQIQLVAIPIHVQRQIAAYSTQFSAENDFIDNDE